MSGHNHGQGMPTEHLHDEHDEHDEHDRDAHDGDMAGHEGHAGQEMAGHGGHAGHSGHGDHVGQFRRLFWIMLGLSVPTVLLMTSLHSFSMT